MSDVSSVVTRRTTTTSGRVVPTTGTTPQEFRKDTLYQETSQKTEMYYLRKVVRVKGVGKVKKERRDGPVESVKVE